MTTNPKPRIDFASYRELQRLAAENRAAALADDAEKRPALALVRPTTRTARLERLSDDIVRAMRALVESRTTPLTARIKELETRLARLEGGRNG
jgi:hypothetical protein